MRGKRRSLLKKLGITALIAVIVLMAFTYVGVALFFEDHYFYHTKIDGEDFSYKTPVEAEEIIYEKIYRYSLEITGREELSDTIWPAEIGLQCVLDDSMVKIKQEQKPGLWIMGFFREYSYDLPKAASYDEAALNEKLEHLVFFKKENIRAPSDAYIKYEPEKKQYTIVEASPGTEIEKEKAVTEIKKALEALEPEVDLDEAGCYKNAEKTSEDETLKKALEKANGYIKARIVYDWNGNEVVVDGDTIKDWVAIDKSRVSLKEDKIKEFVDEQAREYDTYGKNRIFHTTDGRQIELKSGAYGWKTDKETETEALIKAVKSGETVEKEPAYSYTAAEPGQTDIGDTYVEIDLGSQHLYLYVDGENVLESDFVSGNAARGFNTPAGVFGLTYKTKNAVLRGADYETPVSYWMPFNGNIGMHDATWRSSFGGEIYKTNGSHGCINLPFEKAKIIYEYVYTGFPVVCYY